MMKTMTRILAATAAMGLAFAPIAAQANTRAGDSGAVYSVSNAAPGIGRDAEGESFVGIPIAALLIGGVALVTTIVAFADTTTGNNDQSPGT